MDSKILDRFWSKVNKNGPIHPIYGQCWEWNAFIDRLGYGSFSPRDSKMKSAHRVSWEIHNGAIPKGDHKGTVCVLHCCDNRACVNPDHLFLGTHQDNMRDRDKKGRGAIPDNRGEKHGMSKLTEDLVREIRALWGSGKVSQKRISDLYGIHQSAVSNIVNRKLWGHM